MKKLIIALAFMLALTGCSINKAYHATNVVDLATKSLHQYAFVEESLKEESDVFSDEEKELLGAVAEKVLLSRAEIFRLYNAGGIEAMANGSSLLERYQELRVYYAMAIKVVEENIPEMADKNAIELQIHINTVKQLDSSIQGLLSAKENQEQALKAAVTMMSVVARVVSVIGA